MFPLFNLLNETVIKNYLGSRARTMYHFVMNKDLPWGGIASLFLKVCIKYHQAPTIINHRVLCVGVLSTSV